MLCWWSNIKICDCIGICSTVFTQVPDSIFTKNLASGDFYLPFCNLHFVTLHFVIEICITEMLSKSCGVLFFFKGISLIENESKVVQPFKAGLFKRNYLPEHL